MALKPFSGDLDPIKQAPRLKPYDGPLDGEEKNPLLSSAKAGVGHGIKSVGTVLKDVGLPQLGGKIGGFGQEIVEANPPQITSLGDIVESPLTALQEGVGQAVASLPPTLAGAGVGAAAGGAIGGPIGAVIGGGVGAFAPNLVAEYGEIRDKQAEEGIDDKSRALLGAAGAAGLETLADATIAGRFLPKPIRKALPSISPLPEGAGIIPRLGQAGKAGLMGAGTEAATEAAQSYIERAGGGQPITTPEAHEEAALSAALGGLGGGSIRGGIELVSPTREQAQPPQAEQAQPPQPDLTDFIITPDGEIVPRSEAGQTQPQPSGIAGLLPAPPNFEVFPSGTIVPRGTPVEEITPGLPPTLQQRMAGMPVSEQIDFTGLPIENINIGLPPYEVDFIEDQASTGIPPQLGPLARAASRAPMMPGVPYTAMPQLGATQDAEDVRSDEGRVYPGRDVGGRGAVEGRADLQQQAQEGQIIAQAEQQAAQAEVGRQPTQEGGAVRGGLTAGELAPITPVQPTGEPADERQEGQGQAPRQDAEILGQPATEGRVKADQPVAEPASGPVAEAGRGASPFEPTHELPNGTPVRPNLDDSGKPIKGEWVDADGDIWEDDQAQPIERPESRPPMQAQESAQVAAPAEERTSSEAEGNEVVQIRDVYGKSHFVRRKEFVGDAMLIRRFDRDGKFIGRIHRENIISDDAPTPYFADREIIGIEPTKEHPNGRAFKSQAAAKRFQAQHKLEGTHEVKPYQDGFILSKRGEQPEPAAIDQAAHEAATSPENDLPQPTEAQKEAGNYKKGHVALHGLDITIENPRGSERSGTDKSGKPWRVEMAHHYGYIKRTEGADGDQVDVFIGPNPDSDKVFVVNQVDPSTKRFDEHKVMLGFDNAAAARKGYLANYAKGWKGLGSIDPMSVETFKKELAKGVFRKPVKTQREDIADTETRIPEEAEPAPPQEQDTDDELAKLDKLYVTAREMVGDRADEKIRSILGSATTKAIGWLEFEGDQYRISLEHLFRTGQVNVNIAGDDKKVSRVTRVSDDADLGHAMGALLAAVNEGATIRIDPPQQEKPETEKPRAESKPKETTGSAEDDARLESFRKQIKERKRRGLGDQLASAASQRAYELLEAKAKADPSKWNVGNGVGHRVVGQISRGFRIVEIDPETKLAMIRSVADTGLTTSGGNADRIEDSWVHIASLVRDRKYDAPAAQPELDEATEQPTEAAQSEPEKPTAPRAKSPRMTLAEKLAKRLEDGETISSKTLFADADAAFGGTQAEGTYSPKDAYDAMEAAVNLYIMLNEPAKAHGAVSAVSAADQAERLHELTKRLPTQTRRDEEMDEFQQFSTPPALAYVANWSANIKPTDTMMEPSAGTGDLAVWARNADAKLVLNELSKRRAELLRELFPKARVFTENAEQLNNVLPADARPTVVVMNPPFSATAGRKKGERKTSHGAQHIEQALKRLQPGGRLVAIVGEGMAMDRPAFRAWWDKIKNEYNVRANIGISGKTYAKYGTTFDNQILVIDKTGPTTGDVITGNVERPSELPGILEDIRNDRVDTQAADELSQTREPEAAEPGGRREAEPGIAEPVRAERDQPDAVGAGQREARDTERGLTPGEVAEPGATELEGSLAVSGRPGEDGRRGDIGGRTAADEDAGRGRGVSPGSAAQRDDGDERSATDVIQPSESSPAPKVVDDGVTFDVVAETPKAETPFTESVFEQYTPQKVKVKGAKPHPGKLVQSAAMAAVEPPAPNYTPKLPKEVIEQGLLSDAQLEAVVYAGQAHTEFLPSGVRRGFFIGDGTGVGKGREISGIILDNQRQGRDKAVWISFNEGLINDAKRDFKGIGGDEGQIFWHGKTKAADPITAKKGILFTTYSTLRGGEKKQASETDQKKGKTRVQQIAEWLGKDFDGVIVFDEAHKMGNAVQVKGKRGTSKPSQQALAGIELQAELPKARVVYVSATGATEVMNLAYASRLGLWGEGTPFANVADFISDVSEGGVAAMELVSRDMKALGMYLARSLSYDGVTYDRLEHELTPLQHDVYNELAKAWQTVLHNVNLALEETGQGQNADAKSAAMSRFWGSHQRFFNQVITSLMTPSVIDDIRKQIMAGNAVVIQLTNTNEAEQERQAARAAATETPLEEMDFTPRQALMEYIRTGFPVQQFEEYEDEDGNTRTRPVTDASGNPVFNQDMVARRDNLLRTLEQIRVPDNPIDEIINAFGSDMVAEVTGRGRRFVRERDDKGSWTLAEQKRGPQAARADATAFQGDRKKILIFSDAGGTGYSFHADNTAVNQRRRIHYILQPGWRADGAVQGFGRTHRTNQASAPHYVLPTTNLKAQKRFVSSIARRLDQLGALTRGQRDASSQGLFTAADNLESEYASEALFNFFDDLYNGKTPLDPMATLEAMGLEGIVDKKTGGLNSSKMPTVPKFLNRLLSLTQEQQDQVFDEFMQRLDDVVRYAIDQGTYDTGLETLTAQSIKKASEEVVHTDERTGAKTRLVELDVTNPVRYVTFKEAQKAQESMLGEFKGWFRNEKTGQVFGLMDQGKWLVGGDKEEERGIMLTLRGRRYINKVSRILSGKDYKKIGGTYKEVKTFSKLEEPEAKALWEEQRKAAPKTETIRYGMLVGAILPIWNRVTGTPKIFRTQTDDGERFLGRLLTKKDAEKTMRNLGIGSDAAKLSTAEQYEAIEKGARAILANEWEIAPAMVSGERRLEIIPGRAYLTRAEQELLTRQGVFVERINWQERFFIPRGEKGPEVFARVVADKPVVELAGRDQREAQEDDDEFKERFSRTRPAESITETKAFKRWFEGSKVVDAEGKPLVVYHGTKGDIAEFDKSQTVDGGFHFGTREQASMRVSGAGKNLMPVYLSARNLQRSKDMGGNWKAKIRAAKAAGKDGIVYLNRYEGLTSEVITRLSDEGLLDKLDRMSDAEFRRAVPEARDSYIVFEPTQIKSAIGNVGTFDPANPNILYSRQAESIPENGVSVREAQSVIAEIQKALPGTAPVSIRVVESQSEIEGAPTDSLVEAVIRMRGPRAELTVVAGNIGTADDLVKVVREELVGHFGLRNLMGSEFNSLMDDIKAAARVNPNVAKMWRELSGRDPKTGETVNRNADYFGDPDAVIADELISKLAREKSRLPILKRIYQKLMAWLRKVGLVRGPMNVWELEGLVARSEAALRRSNVFDITKPATTRYHRAWHGSPHEFDEFSLQKIGTGEGAQAYGYGLYFASSKAVAKWYRDKLSKYEVLTPNALEALTKHAEKNEEAANLLVFYNDYKEDNPDISLRDVYYEYIDTLDNMIDTTPIKEDFEKAGILSRAKGRLYEVELAPKEDDYLDWDKPLSEQSEKVQAILTRIKPKGMSDKTTGEELYIKLSEQLGKQDQAQFTAGGFPHMDGWRRDDLASQALHQLGIPGIRYKDATARGTDKESYNYVIFDDRLVQVVNRFSAVSLAGADESRQTVAARLWQRLGTNSPYFKRWFKDSKIRKAGKPMVVYHGTNTDIAAFDKGVLGDATRHSTAGLGFFFATDLDAAATYAEKATRARGGRETVGGYYLSIQNPYVVTSELLDRRMGNLSAAEFRAKLERAGHDGIYVKDAGYIVAFEPEQVKSIENVGTFDPMEAEVRYSRRTPDTGEPIDPVDPNAAPRFEQRLRDITVSDVKTLGGDLLERFRPIGLQALGRRQIVDVYGEAVPALHEYDRLAQAYAADSNKTQQDADKVAQDWGKLERKTADKLADIMHQSTLNGVDVSQSEYAPKWTDEAVSQDFNEELAAALKEKRRLQTLIKSVPGGAKAELWERLEAVSKTVERMSKPWSKKAFTKKRQAEEAARKAAYNRLRPEFTALPKEAQAIYTKARDMYSAHWKAVEQALVDRIERSEAVESEKRRIIDQLRLRFRKQLPDIYFPLHRTGDYVIVVKNADGMNEAVMFAETPRQAKKLRAELMRRYAGTDKQVMPIGKKKEKSAQDMVSGRFVSEVLGLIGEAGQGAKMDALREQVVQLYLESLPDLSWAKHELHRKGTPGYSRDARRAFAAHMFHGAAHLSRIRYADRLESSLDRMQGQVDSRRYEEDFDAVRAQDVVNEMKKRHDIAMNPPNTPLANLLTSAGFVWYMGLSPASAIVNLSQTPLVAFPVLGGHFGFRKAARSLTKASADITRALAGGGWFKDETAILDRLKSVLALDEYEVIKKGIEDGHISVTLAHELAGVSQGAEQNPAARSIMRGASWMFHTAEMFNRMSTVLAGYRMGRNAIDSTAGYDKSAYGTAIKLNYDSHFDYAADNRPRAMQGPVARVVLLFKQYAQNMIYLLARNGMEGLAAANDFLRGRPISEKRKAAAKVFGGILAMHAMAAGAFGLPFVGTLLAALSWLGSDDDEPWDAEVALRNYLADTIGARPAEALVHGLPRLARDAVPADISRRVGLDNLLLPDVQEGLEGDKWYQAAATAALGPVAGVGLNIAKGAQTMAEGETWRGVEEMLPKALKDILKTGRFAREGVIDKTGLSILDDTTFGEELAQVAGFSPARVLEAFESRSAVYGADRRIEARRRQLMAQWSKARMDRDISSVQEAMQAIREFNKKNPERRITMDSLSRSFKNRQIRIREAESGIYLPRTRRGMLEEGRFFEDF